MSAAMLAHVVRTSPSPANAIVALFGAPRRPEATEPDAVRACECGWTEHFEIDPSTLTITDHWCSGRDCDGSWGAAIRERRVSEHDVLDLLSAECAVPGCCR